MRIAIPCDENRVAQHFGRCPSYAIFDVENGKIIKKEIIASPGHEPGFLPKFLAERGVQKLICCGIGPRALQLFESFGIEVIAGVEGDLEQVIRKFIGGKLQSDFSKCEHFQ
jgi:predicted Fe-Mo cluster-binding NifX family protein